MTYEDDRVNAEDDSNKFWSHSDPFCQSYWSFEAKYQGKAAAAAAEAAEAAAAAAELPPLAREAQILRISRLQKVFWAALQTRFSVKLN